MRERGRVRDWDSGTGHRARHRRSAPGNEKIRIQERGRQWKGVDTRQLIWNGNRYEHREGGFDRGQWEEGNWSKHMQWGYDRGQYKQATAFFFTNMPEEWSYTEMWRTFGKFGRVFDIYCPQRRSKSGRRFGFVRFLNVRNTRELEKQLDQLKVEGQKLWVNLAKYPEEKHKGETARRIIPSSEIVQGKSYADAVRGQEGREYGKSVEKTTMSTLMRGEDKSRAHETQKQPKSGPIWRQKKREEVWSGLEFNVKKEELLWLQGSCVGVAHSVEIVPNLQEKFYMEGYFSCRLRAMGGKLVLMDGQDKDEIKDLVEGAPEWLGQWFSEVKPWSPSMVAKERFVWIRCQGVPLHAWCPEFFEELALVWGKCICLDDSTSKKRRFDVARFLISTSKMDTISVHREVKVNGVVYELRFSEEELTNSLFSLKYDFRPSFNSDSEIEEYWSDATDYTAGCVGVSDGEEGGDNAGEYLSGRGSLPSKERGSKLAVTSNSEAKFEFARKSNDEDRSDKQARRSHSRVGEEESVDVVADSLELDLEEDDAGERGDIEKCVSGSKVGTVSNPKLAARAGDYGPDTHPSRDPFVGYGSNGNWAGEGELIENWAEEGLNSSPLKGREVRTIGGIKKKLTPENSGTKVTNTLEKCSSCSNERGSIEGSREEETSTTQKEEKKKEKEKEQIVHFCLPKINPSRIHEDEEEKQGQMRSEANGGRGSVGAVAEEEESVIKKLEELETRDRAAKEKESLKGPNKEQKETKKSGIDRKFCRLLWGAEDFDWVAKDAVGLSGGMVCIWNSKVLRMMKVWEGENFIGIQGRWVAEDVCVNIINIYSPGHLAVKNVEEKVGSKAVTLEMREFNNFIMEAELIDTPLVGRKFTWYQPSGKLMSRIDRFLLSEEWLNKWGEATQWGLTRSVSDHCPILLRHQKVNWGPKPFRFFDVWLEQEGCQEVIREAWRKENTHGWAGFRLKEKLKSTKEALKIWSRNMVPEIERKMREAMTEIAQLDVKGEAIQLSEGEIERRKQASLIVWDNIRFKESMMQQKSRKAWLANGDANMKYFHNCVKGRWKRNEINSIHVKGVQLTEVDKMKEEIANFFEETFSEEQWVRPSVEGLQFKQISPAANDYLIAPFTEEEIKTAVWDCESSKAPGPDGFNFKFIKSEWETIRGDVTEFLHEFQKNGKIVKGLNTSFIVLVPKVENPQKIEEYRPISLIGGIYKILAKLLANRLKKVLEGIVGEQQMAFLSGRQLMDGVVIANEVIDEVKKKRKEAFLFKIDLEKAYDKVSWRFLDFMMQKSGFSNTWREWIMECLRSSMVSVLVNGSPTRQFSMSRGLRQGDPLSPFLFLIIAEGINGLVMKAVEKGLLEGVEVGGKGFKISHLQYADDTLLFGTATEENVWAMKSILRTFELVLGLKINFNKSQLIGIGVKEEWLEKMAWILCCKKGVLPFKYLGVPIGGRSGKLSFWKPVLEGVNRKLSTWNGRFLSLGGRITLINSVLTSLPVFWMSVFLIPKGTILFLDKIRRRFLWGGVEGGKKINWVRWDKVCRDKEQGGLGVKDLRKFNLALLGKWWGRLVNEEEGLWKEVILQKYGKVGEPRFNWLREGYGSGSRWWRDICRLNVLDQENDGWLAKGLNIKIGEGDSVKFWWDDWSGRGILANKYPRLYLISVGKDNTVSQMGWWLNGSWIWKLQWRRRLYSWEVQEETEILKEIQETTITKGKADVREWIHSNTGDKIPTKANLFKRGIIQNMEDCKCELCGHQLEETSHLFTHCKVAYDLWNACFRWWGIRTVLDRDGCKVFQQHPSALKVAGLKEGWSCIWFVVVWTLWLARNNSIFNGKVADNCRLLELVHLRSFSWLKYRKKGCLFSLSDWIQEPVACLRGVAAKTGKTEC
ncbi:hypothetical protein SLEP1_g41208 [Rubroshorea leprosula]|uniref:LINE-1 reverse transcriptase-like n=1 Tax=Rubroshorea leprosula TaxID=152421 RepID=A0AAV5L5W9_9ROSI|nr:hypothetical protein SLEP1_g41208 [Rubroshorea leprosula]